MNSKLQARPDDPMPCAGQRLYSLEELVDQLEQQRERMPTAQRRRFESAFWSPDRHALSRYCDVSRGTIFAPLMSSGVPIKVRRPCLDPEPQRQVRAAAKRGATRAGPGGCRPLAERARQGAIS